LERPSRQGNRDRLRAGGGPKGGWGVGIVAVESDDELLRLQSDDPAFRANIGMTYEAYPMPTVTVGRGA
jgi:hypothetical protein